LEEIIRVGRAGTVGVRVRRFRMTKAHKIDEVLAGKVKSNFPVVGRAAMLVGAEPVDRDDSEGSAVGRADDYEFGGEQAHVEEVTTGGCFHNVLSEFRHKRVLSTGYEVRAEADRDCDGTRPEATKPVGGSRDL
jgi:hypothetical protein